MGRKLTLKWVNRSQRFAVETKCYISVLFLCAIRETRAYRKSEVYICGKASGTIHWLKFVAFATYTCTATFITTLSSPISYKLIFIWRYKFNSLLHNWLRRIVTACFYFIELHLRNISKNIYAHMYIMYYKINNVKRMSNSWDGITSSALIVKISEEIIAIICNNFWSGDTSSFNTFHFDTSSYHGTRV